MDALLWRHEYFSMPIFSRSQTPARHPQTEGSAGAGPSTAYLTFRVT